MKRPAIPNFTYVIKCSNTSVKHSNTAVGCFVMLCTQADRFYRHDSQVDSYYKYDQCFCVQFVEVNAVSCLYHLCTVLATAGVNYTLASNMSNELPQLSLVDLLNFQCSSKDACMPGLQCFTTTGLPTSWSWHLQLCSSQLIGCSHYHTAHYPKYL